MRISEVEIISMLMPASASAWNSLAEMPGLVRIPAPTSESLPISSSKRSSSKPICPRKDCSRWTAFGPSEEGNVNEMSVSPVAAAETFCTIMSMLMPASATAVKMSAALPASSGTPTTVILASLRSWATPAMMGASMVLPSP